MSTDGLRLVLIVRTSKRKKEARSPKQQRSAARACATVHGYEIVAELDSGRSESGKTMDRETVHRAMEMIRCEQADGIIVSMLDRLGRAPIEELATFVNDLYALGGVLVPADGGGQPVDWNDPTTRTNVVMQAQIAWQYWQTRANGALKTRDDAVTDGKYVAAAPPGFGKVGGKLVRNADADLMRQVFLAAGSGSLRHAQALLRERWPDGRWDADRVRKLLRSPAYKGWSVSGSLVNRRAHAEERIVTEAEWLAAQQAPRERRSNGAYPLSGIATCECGAPMVGQLKSVPGRKRTYRTMRCSATAHVTISADALEAHVREWLRPLIAGGYFDVEFGDAELVEAQAAVERIRAEREEFAGDIAFQRDLGAEGRRAQAAALRTTQEQAEARLREVSGHAAHANRAVITEDMLDTPEGLTDAARRTIAVQPIIVTAGRGLVTRRVALPVLDGGAGVLAA